MASDYGLNFGFRRSDESTAVREGRLKTPVSGGAIQLGSAVKRNAASLGYLKVVTAGEKNEKPLSGQHGLLVQEEVHIRSSYEADMVDSYGLGVSRADKLSVIVSGAGTKVWFQNTAGSTRADGRVISAVTICDLTGVAVGDKLGWDGTKWVKSDGGTTLQDWLSVTAVDVSGGYVEGVLLF